MKHNWFVTLLIRLINCKYHELLIRTMAIVFI